MYEVVKFLHVFLAIVAVGFNATYAILLGRAAREPEHEAHVLRTVKVLDDRFANPAYGGLLLTGLLMVGFYWPRITDFWIATALALYAILVAVGAAVFTPTLRRQIAVIETEGPSSPDYRALSRRGTVVGIFLAIVVTLIVFLMVTKPTI
ncbi:MAG: DUF2269 domain-containing protein [Actinomycetota bacterium]|nr:DUF2269 domain-containing protein [Actinomycetota bacterium]